MTFFPETRSLFPPLLLFFWEKVFGRNTRFQTEKIFFNKFYCRNYLMHFSKVFFMFSSKLVVYVIKITPCGEQRKKRNFFPSVFPRLFHKSRGNYTNKEPLKNPSCKNFLLEKTHEVLYLGICLWQKWF